MSTIDHSTYPEQVEDNDWRQSFGYIFWGSILVFINISIDGHDLLPNGIGYACIAIGASRVANQSRHFTIASALSWVLVLTWCCSFFATTNVAWSYATAAFNVAMYWFLLGGIMEVSIAKHRWDLADRAYFRRVVYAAITIGGMLLFLSGPLAGFLVVAAAIIGLVIGISIIHLVYRVRRELA